MKLFKKEKKKTSLFKKIVLRIIALVLLIILVIVSKTILEGYYMYKDAVSKISIEEKVNNIRSVEGYTKITEVSKNYVNAVIAIEDHRFYFHSGIDYASTLRAILTNIEQKSLAEGGSTISQQLAKNMYFTQEKKFERKIAELFVVNYLEKTYTKDEILELYINIVYFGNGYYGINKASLGYLNKDPKDLNLSESTLLAGLPNAPSIYALNANPDLAVQRQKQVIQRMLEFGYITAEEANSVK